jgi:crotonobetainyl-CoA:carnitine CoA-transferase CaiB-like acyl-CoA transferase
VGPINDLAQVFADPHVQARGMRVSVDHPVAGPTPLVASPIRFSETPVTYENPPPLLGQHTTSVLSSLIGLSSSDLETLKAQGIVGPDERS